MFFVHDACPICEHGAVGFLICTDTDDVILMCEECDSVWLDPITIIAEAAIFTESPDFVVPGVGCSLLGSRWATRQEIEQRGWVNYIAGEGKAMNEESYP